MKKLDLTIRFTTPAFLGNAEQSGQWRTPPFKALLRQWWRVAYATGQSFNVDIESMRNAEGELFGDARSDKQVGENSKSRSGKSKVILRLDNKWSLGKLNQVPDIGRISVGNNCLPGSLYSGYGPVEPGPKFKGPKLKGGNAIESGESAKLRIAFPYDSCIEQAIALAREFGTVGGRSRNGWGSFELDGDLQAVKSISRNWKDAMMLDWPHALGKDDEGELVWSSKPMRTWEESMKILAQARADLRRAVPERLILAHPDTKRTMDGWEKNARVPNSIRFKVKKKNKQYVARIFHIPCRPGGKLWTALTQKKKQEFVDCFKAAHAFLDNRFSRTGVNS